ncbi:unnamed protein product [Peronospora belbahrii]|uniref:Retroviral polymerase SH3-like domain-containing protein n=1 Tax=Peronospora belbahrii TaxID=622444 RepID=A0AAU9KL03_9STRA|nr:unnamed protein product [Peronospora belbahrii]
MALSMIYATRSAFAVMKCASSQPASASDKRASPMEILTKRAPDLGVLYTLCSFYRNPRKNSLEKRSQVGVIIGRSDVTKGYRYVLQKENKVVATQHVKDIETLSDDQNIQLQRELDFEDQVDGTVSTCSGEAVLIDSRCTERAQYIVYERDPKNCGEAMRSSKREGLETAMREEIEALEEIRFGGWSSEVSAVMHCTPNGYIKRRPMRTAISSGSRLNLLHSEMSKLLQHGLVPAKHGDIPNAYVKADKESHLEIFSQIPQSMDIDEATMKDLGVSSKNDSICRNHAGCPVTSLRSN